MAGDLETLFEWIGDKQAGGHRVALATVVQTWSSAPRTVGSQLAIADDGEFAGSVSAGCVEGAVIEEALAILGGNPARTLEFDVADQQALDVGLACGGRIRVLVHAIGETARALPARLAVARRAQCPVALVIRAADGAMALIGQYDCTDPAALLGDAELFGDGELGATRAMLREGRSGFVGAENLFIRAFPAPSRLYLIGAVHIAQILAPMAQQAGFATRVIDPRRAFATPARFGDIELDTDWPDDALRKVSITHADAIVTLTHDPKLDDAALIIALDSPAYYIGALGSRRTHAQRVERLAALGFGSATGRIHGPVGLPLGGRAPAEIAVSILAHLIAGKYAQ